MTSSNKLISGLAAGAIIGAAAGILFAPKPGEETRQVVGAKAVDLREKAGGYIGSLRDKIKKARGTEAVEQHSDNGVQTFIAKPPDFRPAPSGS